MPEFVTDNLEDDKFAIQCCGNYAIDCFIEGSFFKELLQLVISYQLLIIQLMSIKQSFKNSSRKEQLINQQRKKLQQLRLQTQSQNTKLLKIQQKQREVETEYQNEKKNMQQTLAKLALEAENFKNKQAATTQQFQSQKQQIFANDRKKQLYLKQKQQLILRNEKRREEIKEKQQKLTHKKQKLSQIRQQIKRHQIYQDFLKQVKGLSQDFNTGEFDQFSVMTILERYSTMKKKKEQLSEVSKRLEQQKDKKLKHVQFLKKQRQDKIIEYNLKVKTLKQSIQKYSEQNIQLSSQLEGKLNENGERQRQLGQIIFSIQGLYLSIVGEEKHPKTTLQMLEVIRQQRKKLKQYLQLFQKKTQERNDRIKV